MRADRMKWSTRSSANNAVAGFTLLEVLVAIAIFSLVSILAMSGYNELSRQSIRATDAMDRVRKVQSTITRMTQDFEQLEPRPIREPLGQANQPMLLLDPRDPGTFSLTRAGWTNPAGLPRPTLQRVAYRFADGKLYRAHWTMLDRTLNNQPIEVELLDGVRALSLRFMDANRQWHDQWPPAGAANVGANRLSPIAVEVTVELNDWGKIVRLMEVPG